MCASLAGLVLCFIACFILLVIAPLHLDNVQRCNAWGLGLYVIRILGGLIGF